MLVFPALWRGLAVVVAGLLLPASGCAAGPAVDVAGSAGSPTLFIASDLPLQGVNAHLSQATNDALRLYLEQVGSRAGDFTVALRIYDDSTAARGGWDDETCVRNAHDHLVSDEVAVMGTYNSGCARLMVPVMNLVTNGPLLMVSHANSNPGLTRSWGPGEPEKFYPTGMRSFARVATPDDQNGTVSAGFLGGTLHRKRCYVLNDGQAYGKGLAEAFVAAAAGYGVRVLGNEQWDVGKASYVSMFQHLKKSNPDCIMVAGDYGNNSKQLLIDKVAVLGSNDRVTLMAPGFSGAVEMSALPSAQGIYLANAGPSLGRMVAKSRAAASFRSAFTRRYGTELTSADPLYAVAALQVILAAIASGDGTRAGVNRAVFGSADLTVPAAGSITGEALTIDHRTGDLTSSTVTILRIRGGKETYLSSVRVP